MKFYGNGSVWDVKRNTVLCRFVNGEYETSDQTEINKLANLGYMHDSDTEDMAVIESEDSEPLETVGAPAVKRESLQDKAPKLTQTKARAVSQSHRKAVKK